MLARPIDDRLAILILEVFTRVAEGEIQLAVGAEDEGVDAMIVLRAADAAKQHLAFVVGLEITVLVIEHLHLVVRGDNQHRFEQIFQSEYLSRSQAQVRFMGAGSLGADGHFIIQMAIFQNH